MSSWTVEKADSSLERKITTAAIISDVFLRSIVPIFSTAYIKSPYCRTVIEWCIAYYNSYKKAPNTHIQDIYDSHCRNRILDSEVSHLIAAFLRDLSQTYDQEKDQYNSQYILDKALEYFRWRAVDITLETVQGLRDQGELLQAEASITEFRKVVSTVRVGCNPLTDKELLLRAFSEEEKEDVLFRPRGAVGELMGEMSRDDLVAIAAPFKRGKSFFFLWLAVEALLSGCSVAFFSMGDMTREQLTKRLLSGLSARPLKAGTFIVPVLDCALNQSGVCKKDKRKGKGNLPKNQQKEIVPGWIPCTSCRGTKDYHTVWIPTEVDFQEIIDYKRAVRKGRSISRMIGDKLKLEAWPRKSASLNDVEALLRIWEDIDGFIPDVIITDYADIMKPDARVTEYRHQLNFLWEGHDSLAKSRHCLVVTGTQTTRAALKNDVADDMIAEDIRKLAHVSLMVGLNQTPEEKKCGIMRMKVLASRHEEFNPNRECYLLQNLSCGQFCLDSEFK